MPISCSVQYAHSSRRVVCVCVCVAVATAGHSDCAGLLRDGVETTTSKSRSGGAESEQEQQEGEGRETKIKLSAAAPVPSEDTAASRACDSNAGNGQFKSIA